MNDAIIKKKIKAFKLWLYKRILKIPLAGCITNIEVLRRMNKNIELVKTLKIRKLQYLEHNNILRNENRYSIL